MPHFQMLTHSAAPPLQAITNFAKDGSGSINAAAADSPVTKSSRHRGVYWDNNKQLWRAGIGSKVHVPLQLLQSISCCQGLPVGMACVIAG